MKTTTFLATLMLWYSIANCSTITVSEDGGYSNIIVAINKDVSEDENLIPAIMALFRNASAFLNIATRGAFFFEEVTIAIPSSWASKSEYEGSYKDYSIDADIEVSESEGPDEPSTLQVGGCGEPGEYIRLPPKYLRNMVLLRGKPDKIFIREWAKFRYGVFDERVTIFMANSNPRLKSYYHDEGKIHPATCTKNIASVGQFEYGSFPCDPSVSSKCKFRVYYSDLVKETASLMYSTFFDSVNRFCDENDHNKKAPNQHNIQCQYKSTWEVIKSNKDYKIVINPSLSKHRPEPRFLLRRTIQSSGKTVMVLDISGSMDGTPIQLLHRTTVRHVLQFAPDDSEIGIVVFGTLPTVRQYMTKVNNSTRQTLANSIPRLANGGGTGIGNGLLKGLEVLKASGVVEGSVILLITDGEENAEPFINDVTPTLLSLGVILNVISYGELASLKLEEVAKLTGGATTIFKDILNEEADTEELGYKIMQATTLQSDIKFEGEKIKSEDLIFNQPDELVMNVPLDAELGKNTVFSFRWTYKVVADIQLTSPSGKAFDRHSEEWNSYHNLIEFKFRTAETGIWKILIRKQATENIDIKFTLISEPTDSKVKPVQLKTWLSNFELDFGKSTTEIKVYARVTKSRSAVVGVIVEGLLEAPHDSIRVSMKDDGIGHDLSKDDGIYTGVVTKLKGDGRYLFKAKVIGGKNAKIKKQVKRHFNKRSVEDFEDEEYDIDYQEVSLNSSFERVGEGGILVIKNWTPTLGDIVKPARVIDLTVKNSYHVYDKRIVTLSWTAAGDDFLNGNATALDVRISTELNLLIEDFDNQFQINDSHTLNGTLQPTVGGSVIWTTLQIPSEFFLMEHNELADLDEQAFIGLRYQDEANNRGDLSNIVSALFVKLDITPPASINDLTITNSSVLSNGWAVTLRWTAAGDDDFEGNATLLNVWMSTKEGDLLNTTSRLRLNKTLLLDGSLSITKGGFLTWANLLVSHEWIATDTNNTDKSIEPNNFEVFFGLIYYDEANNSGNMSNLVSAILRRESTLYLSDVEKDNKAHIFIGVVIAIVFLLGLLAATYLYIQRKTSSYRLVLTYSSPA